MVSVEFTYDQLRVLADTMPRIYNRLDEQTRHDVSAWASGEERTEAYDDAMDTLTHAVQEANREEHLKAPAPTEETR